MTRFVSTALIVGLVLPFTMIVTAQDTPSKLPQRLEKYVTNAVKLTAEERNQLSAGSPVAKLVEADDSQDTAVFSAIWIDAPMRRYVQALNDIEAFERGGGFTITKRISAPPRAEDFAQIRLADEDVEDMRDCQIGDCIVKLGEQAVQRLRTEIKWDAPNARSAADSLMQRLALEYVNGYLEGGNERLAVYRDHSRPRFVAEQFRAMIDQMPELARYMTDLRRYLLEFPKTSLAGSSSFLYWQETEFGLRPTIRISHVVIREGPDDTVVASKMLYASHYFWTGLELRVLLPDAPRGRGFWFVNINRIQSDGLDGVTGRLIRGRVRNEVRNGAMAALQRTKRVLESVHP